MKAIFVVGVAAMASLVSAGWYASRIEGRVGTLRDEVRVLHMENEALGGKNKTLAEQYESLQKISTNNDSLIDGYKAQLKESEATAAKLTIAREKIGKLQRDLNQTQNELAYSTQISGYWRDLFDYSRNKNRVVKQVGQGACAKDVDLEVKHAI